MLGSVLETKADGLLRKLQTISWNKLSVNEQKDLQMLILYAQRFGTITWFLMPLNLASFIEV